MQRLAVVQELLAEQKLDALLLTSPVARFYATGLETSAGVVLVTRDEGFFFTDFRYIEVARQKVTQFRVDMSTKDKSAQTLTAETLHRCKAKRVGFEADTMTVSAHEGWLDKLGLKLIKAQDALAALRAVKGPDEIERMTAAQRIAEAALEELLGGVLRAGMTEKQVAAELIYRMLRHGADSMSFEPIVVSGPNSSLPHGVPGDRQLADGDFVTMDFGCVKDGYCSDMTRTVAIGHASEDMRAVYHIVLEAQTAGIAAARAEVTGREIDAAARAVIEKAGYGECFGHGFGHGIGLEVHENPGAGPMSVQPLPVGAVISAEPGIYIPGKFGVRIEDVIVLTQEGCTNLMRAPKELLIV